MQPINTNWQPRNRITTPLEGEPVFVNSGIIKAVMKSGEKVSVGRIDYQEFDEENFQYVISPYWEIVDGLPPSVFQGIPGIDMDLRLQHYYRVNYIPTFIAERTPSENREDLWELMASVELEYYDRFEWLLRTKLRSANDNLIVERRRTSQRTEEYRPGVWSELQYGDRVIVDSMAAISDTAVGFLDGIFAAVTGGIDIVDRSGNVLIEAMGRHSLVPVVIAQHLIAYEERLRKRQEGIERAKTEGKYRGRKPIEVDEHLLGRIKEELDQGLITVEEAMRRTGIGSRSTFYRKLRKLGEESGGNRRE